jgi:ABC-2 type transport system ATP-binding protein
MADTPNRSQVIVVDHLRKNYAATVAVDDVSFTVEEGEIFGVIGPNGAGKTTAVECCSGLRIPDGGSVRVLGLDPRRDRPLLRERVGVQLQEASMPPKLRVGEALELFASFYRQPADAEALMDLLDLSAKRDEYVKQLSGGLKQRLSIGLALIGNPAIAILDELTTGLDPQARRDAWELIEGVRDRGVTVLLVTHFMDEAERLCDRVMLVDHGRVTALDTPAALAERAGGSTRLSFRPSGWFSDDVLTRLPGVTHVERESDRVRVTGTGDVVPAVLEALERTGVEAQQVQVHSATLEDAFLRLTGSTASASSLAEVGQP